jgi:hypothetical protein
MGVRVSGFGFSSCLDCWLSYVWLGACFLVITFRVAIAATIRGWPRLGGDVEGSLVSVDLEVQEWRERVTGLLCAMLFSSSEEHAGSQFQHCCDYS